MRQVVAVLFGASVLLAGDMARAQAWQFPASPTGNALTALLEAIDSGTEADVGAFVDAHMDDAFQREMGRDGLVAFFTRLHADLHPFDVASVEKTGPWSGVCVVEGLDSGRRVRIAFGIEERPPHRFNDLDVQAVSEDALRFTSFDELDALLRRRAGEGAFSGVVLAARHGDVLFLEAYGPASKRFDVPNRTDTKFNIGSINKMFTAVAVLQLAEQGRLGLDDPIARYLSDFPKEVAERVTVRHLLQHRSGWGSYWDNETYRNSWPRLRSVDDYMAFIKDISLDFEPGTSRQYSNTGYEVLGAIIEAVSGQDYYAYMREHVYGPAGMDDTDSYEMDAVVENLAIGYMPGEDGGGFTRENTFHHSVKGTPAGGGYATAEDLLRFDRALREHVLLGEAFTDLLFNQFQDARPPQGGLGYAGGGPGINAVVEVDFDTGTTVVVLSNYEPPTAEELGVPIMRMVLQTGGAGGGR